MNQTASQNAEEFGFEPGDIVQEWLWDDDVDDSIRAQIEELTGEDLVDEDYDSAVDGVIVWWRDGDDEDELSDTIVDAYAVLGNDGPLWILTPKPGRPGATSSSTVQSAAQTAGIAALLFEWAIIRDNQPFFTGSSVKYYLQRGARREENMQYPNPEWGYGKVDLYHTFELLT